MSVFLLRLHLEVIDIMYRSGTSNELSNLENPAFTAAALPELGAQMEAKAYQELIERRWKKMQGEKLSKEDLWDELVDIFLPDGPAGARVIFRSALEEAYNMGVRDGELNPFGTFGTGISGSGQLRQQQLLQQHQQQLLQQHHLQHQLINQYQQAQQQADTATMSSSADSFVSSTIRSLAKLLGQ